MKAVRKVLTLAALAAGMLASLVGPADAIRIANHCELTSSEV